MPGRPDAAQKNGDASIALLGRILAPICHDRATDWAFELLAEYDSIAAILEAAPNRVRKATGSKRALFEHLEAVRLLLLHTVRYEVAYRPVFSTSKRLLEYLFLDMAHARTERFRVLFLNSQNRLLRDEVIAFGSVARVTAHPRPVIERAIELGASVLILVHNHPTGDASPSEADIAFSKHIAAAGRTLDIVVQDHVIISKGGWTSMRSCGLL